MKGYETQSTTTLTLGEHFQGYNKSVDYIEVEIRKRIVTGKFRPKQENKQKLRPTQYKAQIRGYASPRST